MLGVFFADTLDNDDDCWHQAPEGLACEVSKWMWTRGFEPTITTLWKATLLLSALEP